MRENFRRDRTHGHPSLQLQPTSPPNTISFDPQDKPLGRRLYWPHFTDEETEAQSNEISSPVMEPVPPWLLWGWPPSPSLGLIFPSYKMWGCTHSLRLGFQTDTR